MSLSVVVCNYNHAHYLPEALQAILEQSRRPMEVIVIDDRSTDNSVEVIEGIARRDPIVHLYRNERNQGPLATANRGLALARGDCIYWGAADDRICPGLFERSLQLLDQHPEAGLCSALLLLISADGRDLGWIRSPVICDESCFLPPEKILRTLNRYGFWFTGQTTIYRRSALLAEADGFLPELAHRADHFVNYAVALRRGACFIPEALATYRILSSGYAESSFDNEELSRRSFALMLGQMRLPRYASLFPEAWVDALERRGMYDFEVRALRRLRQTQRAFFDRLRALRSHPTILDHGLLLLLRSLASSMGVAASAYLWHRRFGWDFAWLAMKLRVRWSSYGRRTRVQRQWK